MTANCVICDYITNSYSKVKDTLLQRMCKYLHLFRDYRPEEEAVQLKFIRIADDAGKKNDDTDIKISGISVNQFLSAVRKKHSENIENFLSMSQR